ncbi:MAG: hypothetical protein KF841_10795 [Phycisphaerae bacterium]|nr:hypothetical protein [Phycisphaerae bacterium]
MKPFSHAKTAAITFAVIILPTGIAACDAVAGLLQTRSTQLIIVNETAFAASPEIRTSRSRNLLEDGFNTGTLITGLGDNGVVGPNQTITIRLSCSELETIAIDGARFRDATFGFPLGDTNKRRSLRRDVDFDCGDAIRVRLTGSLFNYDVAVSVEQGADDGSPFSGLFGSNDNVADNGFDLFGNSNSSNQPRRDSDDEIADLLDSLFN